MLNQKKMIQFSAVIMGFSGFILILVTLLPIALYERNAKINFPQLISPLVKKSFGAADSSFFDKQTDYTKASNWFPANGGDFSDERIDYYSLSIPKLGIENAKVLIGGEDLSDSLVQYPGTALPGKNGNAVVFGHSILPQFYNPSNYLAIFSKLSTLVDGDKVTIGYDGIDYTYEVFDIFEVKPTDIQILDQVFDAPYLTLVTCTPPGHPLKPKRLIVRAEIIKT